MIKIKVRFEEPTPDVPRTTGELEAFAAALKERPGDWALMGVETTPGTARTRAWHVRSAMGNPGAAFAPAGSFETSSTVLCGENRIYIRYIGEKGEFR